MRTLDRVAEAIIDGVMFLAGLLLAVFGVVQVLFGCLTLRETQDPSVALSMVVGAIMTLFGYVVAEYSFRALATKFRTR